MELIGGMIVPTDNTCLLKLPDEMIGKQVEVIAFRIEAKPAIDIEGRERRRKEIREIFKDSLIDLGNFKFDRDEANNCDE